MSALYPVCNVLRNPGTLIDNVYMSESSLLQTAARVLNKETYKYPFNSLILGSTNTLVIQKNIMATHVLVVLEFNPAMIPAGFFLSQGWGFKLCRRLQLQYAGSELLEVDLFDNFMRTMNECETDYKKTSIINNAGQFCTAGAPPTGVSIDNTYRAVIPIVLPHSSVNSFRQMPFDCSCLNQSINVRLTLNDPSSVWGWAGDVNDNGGAIPAFTANMNQLVNATWVVGQS